MSGQLLVIGNVLYLFCTVMNHYKDLGHAWAALCMHVYHPMTSCASLNMLWYHGVSHQTQSYFTGKQSSSGSSEIWHSHWLIFLCFCFTLYPCCCLCSVQVNVATVTIIDFKNLCNHTQDCFRLPWNVVSYSIQMTYSIKKMCKTTQHIHLPYQINLYRWLTGGVCLCELGFKTILKVQKSVKEKT